LSAADSSFEMANPLGSVSELQPVSKGSAVSAVTRAAKADFMAGASLPRRPPAAPQAPSPPRPARARDTNLDTARMQSRLRSIYNAHYSDKFYEGYLAALSKRLGCPIPFRVAETPFFIPAELRDRLASAARGIVDEITDPRLIEKLELAIPDDLDVPGMDALPNCIQVDFAITRNGAGELEGKVVELQAFPSLYALMVVQHQVLMAEMQKAMPGMDRDLTIYFGDLDADRFVERFRAAVVADASPEETVLLDLHPETQKTLPDFAATKLLLGVDAVCPTTLVKEGRRLFRRRGDELVPVSRIYNRIVFDELEKEKLDLPFEYTDELDVTWCSHPNWYWVFSKYTLPFISHPAVPRARTLRDLGGDLPGDLSNFVLKPLFSFAGAGVKVDVTHEDIAAVPEEQRAGWLLQEKITYHPGITMPDGNAVKAEVRMMFLRGPNDPKPELVLNLVRLSRGKMLGVDQNKNLTWVGGSVGLFEPSR
jgi:hypothetical protein